MESGDDFGPGALESLDVLAMPNSSAPILGIPTPVPTTATIGALPPTSVPILGTSTTATAGIPSTSNSPGHGLPLSPYEDYDDDGSSDADDEDDDVEMDEEHDPGNYLNPRGSVLSSALSRGSRESGAAGPYAPWGGVDVNTR